MVTCLTGRILTDPKLKFINKDGLSTSICRCTVVETSNGKMNNYFQVIALEDKAEYLSKNFKKNSKIILKGSFKNHIFEDVNSTRHFTNVFLVNYIEILETRNLLNNISIDINKDEEYYHKLCELGYLAIDEDEYYYLSQEAH